METRYITTADGIRLYFQKTGDGPETVLVPNGIHLFDDFKYLSVDRTMIFYDVRNRGRSDSISDPAMLQRGIHNDVEDLEFVRCHFGSSSVSLIGHSYMGLMVALYAMKYPANVNRLVQMGAAGPEANKQYPAHLTNQDAVLREVFSQLGQLQRQQQSEDPEEACRKFWNFLRLIFVADSANASKIHWDRCDLPNERNFMGYWTTYLLPSIEKLNLAPEDFAKAKMPSLVIHGTMDRLSPYGGGREWALKLPDARLVTVENAAHAPWIENPERVFSSIENFLNGTWPETAERVTSLESQGSASSRSRLGKPSARAASRVAAANRILP